MAPFVGSGQWDVALITTLGRVVALLPISRMVLYGCFGH